MKQHRITLCISVLYDQSHLFTTEILNDNDHDVEDNGRGDGLQIVTRGGT